MKIEDVFQELGYKLVNHGNYYSTSALYRQGVSPTSLTIYPKNNIIIDWVTGEKVSLSEIVKASLQLNDLNQAKQWLETKNVRTTIEQPELTLNEPKIFPIEILQNLKPDHSYWLNRGISREVLDELGGGIADLPKMKGRYCFIIWNSKKQIIGIQGRSLDGKNPVYKILGSKSEFCFPMHVNLKDIKQKSEVILVEGVGCALSLMVAGIRNSLVLFGISLSNHQLSTLISLAPRKILVSTNRDHGPGIIAADKLQRRLWKFFDKRQVEIRLPPGKDFNEVLQKQQGIDNIIQWYKN